MKISKLLFSLLCMVFLAACSSPVAELNEIPHVQQGEINLQDWDFSKNGSIELSGEWRFYWNQLIQFDQIDSSMDFQYVPVPDIWTHYKIDGETLPAEGYATYYLKLRLPEEHQTFGLYIQNQGSAYTLWINGEKVQSIGQVGTSLQNMVPAKEPVVVFFQPDGEVTEFLIQISNFNHRKGGFRNSLLLGPSQLIHEFQLQNWFFEAFSIGVLFIMGLYHLFLYIYRTKNPANVYFGMLCWLITIRMGITNQSILLTHLPIVDWALALRLEYLGFYLIPVFFILFLQSLYPEEIDSWFVRIVIFIGVAFSGFAFFTDTITLSNTASIYQIVFAVEIIYYLFFMYRIIRKKRDGAYYITLASLIVFFSVAIETLAVNEITEGVYLFSFIPIRLISSFSFLAFIFVQAIMLANRFSKSFGQVERLSGELEEINNSLEFSEKKYRTVFEESNDVIFIAGLDDNIVDISPSCQEVLGYAKEELLQMKVFDLIENPKEVENFKQLIRNEGQTKNFEVQLKRKDGQLVDTLINATPRFDENGEVIGAQGNVRDITARKQAEMERLRAIKAEQIAFTDSLTNIYNRRFFFENAVKELERTKRNGTSLSVLLFDIDHFKDINDSFGHLVGDDVLIKLTELVKQHIRGVDLFARYGGEEFIILMPETDIQSAKEISERLKDLVSKTSLLKTETQKVSVTISIGIAEWDQSMKIDNLLHRADLALYKAKETGRNKVFAWREINSKDN